MSLRDQVIIVALEKLFAPTGYFDITAVDNLRRLVGFTLAPDTEAMLRLMHCVHYSAMRAGMREELAAIVVSAIQSARPDIDFTAATTPTAKPSPSWAMRMLRGIG